MRFKGSYRGGGWRPVLLGVALALGGCAGARSLDGDHPHERLLRRQVETFNRHDAEGFRGLVTDDVAWYMVEGDEVVAYSEGVGALVSGMEGYFAGTPGVRAELEHVHAAGSYAFARERVSWTGADGGTRSQAAYCCYEIRDGRINAVWYFPAE